MTTTLPLKKKIALELFRKYKSNTTKIRNLIYLLWECTLQCNLNCIHCGSDCRKNPQIKDIPLKVFLSVIDNIKPYVNPNKTLIVLTGGEPLLRNDIEICGIELYKRGFPWGLVTNGYLLDKNRFKQLLKSGLRSITVSLDGLEDSHNWLRGNKNSFNKAINAIKLLPRTSNLRYDIVTCVNQKNFPELNNIKNLLINIGIKEWRLFTIFPIGRAKNNKLLQLESNQFKILFDFIKQSRKEGKLIVNYGCEGFLGNYEGEVRDDFFFCRAGINIGSILADGSISACPNLRDNFIQGNIYIDNFIDIWNNKFQKMRDRRWTKTGQCEKCKFYKYCEGNGLHLRDEKTGELMFCHLKRIEEGENASP